VSQPYDVRISARAERDLLRLPEKVGTACVEFIFGPLASHPDRLACAPPAAAVTGSITASTMRLSASTSFMSITEVMYIADGRHQGRRSPAGRR
jgi:hypothetical protein